VLSLLLSVALSGSAFATAEMTLTSGSASVTIFDNGTCIGCVGSDSGALSTTGNIIFSGPVGGWTIDVSAGISFGPADTTIDLSSINAASNGAAPLTVTFSDTGFTTPSPSFLMFGFGTLAHGAGTAGLKAWVDTTNTIFGEPVGGLIGSVGPTSANYTYSINGGSGDVTPYSITEALTLTGNEGTLWSTDSMVTSVPEPATVVLFGSVLLLCASKLRRRKVS
jgi:hypothetical protein